MCNELQHLPEQFNLPCSSQSVDGLGHCVNVLLLVHVGRPNHQGFWHSRVLRSAEVGDVLDPMFRDRSSCVLGLCYCRSSQHSSATMLAVICNIVPLPCCGCTCSATKLFDRHPSRCSADLLFALRVSRHVSFACALFVVEPPTAS